MLFATAGVILVVASIAFPWWFLSIEKEGVINEKEVETFWLDRADFDGGDFDEEYSYADSDKPYKHPPRVAEIARYLAIGAAALALVALGLLTMTLFWRPVIDLRWLMFILLLSVMVSLIAPLYFMAAFPKSWEYEFDRRDEIPDPYDKKFDGPEIPMFHDKFDGTVEHEMGSPKNRTVETIIWGGGAGWFLAVIGGLLQFLALLILYKYMHEVFGIPRSPYEGAETVETVVTQE